jgi:uncharacterized membrane protein YccC
VNVRDWLLGRDGGLRATRRAVRTAILMPALFALGSEVIGNAGVATFAAFGAFALLLLADFGGTLTERLTAQAALVVTGCVFIPIATLASASPWTAAAAMLVVGLAVLFAGVVSAELAGASTSALLSFILPVATPAPAAAIPDRLFGWLLAGVVSLPAVTLLWPAARREPLRVAAAEACRQLAARLTAEAERARGHAPEDLAAVVQRSDAAVATLRRTFLATPYRPSGLTTAARAVVRLVDEVIWLNLILDQVAATPSRHPIDPTVLQVKAAAAVLLQHAGKALSPTDPPQDSLADHLADLERARREMERVAIGAVDLPPDGAGELAAALGPSFRAQELSFAVTAIAEDIDIAVAAEARRWWQKLLGRRPHGTVGAFASAQQRALAHVEPHSVWLRNSVRGAVALGGAVLIADLSGAQHSFWIVLGALSVLRSNALSTGQNVVRGLVGTAIGFAIGGALVALIGTNEVVLWLLLPVAILVAGIAPAISFTAGQAGFTGTLLILYNIISPAGWQVGLVRIEDVAIGFAVSLVVGVLFWPRGATGALRNAVAEAYGDAAEFLRTAAEAGTPVDGSPERSEAAGVRAAAAARRLDDAFREFLAERGRKHLGLAEVASLLTGVAALRLTAEALRDLWPRDGAGLARERIDTPRAQLELIAATERVTTWYSALAQAVAGAGTVPRALPPDDGSNARLVACLGADLDGAEVLDDGVRAHTVRLVWTADHLDAARRLQTLVEDAARSAAGARAREDLPAWLRLRRPDDQEPVSPGSATGTGAAAGG